MDTAIVFLLTVTLAVVVQSIYWHNHKHKDDGHTAAASITAKTRRQRAADERYERY